jgi:hypothetical protein
LRHGHPIFRDAKLTPAGRVLAGAADCAGTEVAQECLHGGVVVGARAEPAKPEYLGPTATTVRSTRRPCCRACIGRATGPPDVGYGGGASGAVTRAVYAPVSLPTIRATRRACTPIHHDVNNFEKHTMFTHHRAPVVIAGGDAGAGGHCDDSYAAGVGSATSAMFSADSEDSLLLIEDNASPELDLTLVS